MDNRQIIEGKADEFPNSLLRKQQFFYLKMIDSKLFFQFTEL